MPANPVLIDSSYYIHLARQGQDPLKSLAVAAAERDLAICGVVRCEVGRGIRHPAIREKFTAFWNVMVNVPTDNRLWEQVEEMAWQLGRQGITLPLTDIIIGCSALRIDAVVLTFDAHFYDIPGLHVTSSLGW
ncbi:MAG: PIN domain-containing protein [Verrucomicrobiota bacterium]